MHTTPLAALVTIPEYREPRQHIFPTPNSLAWYLRQNRVALVQAGALVNINGKKVDEQRMDAVILDIGAKMALKRHSR